MNPLSARPHFHLKYCERCGGLWLRPDGAVTPYCPTCDGFMSELPLRPPRNQRKPVQRSSVSASAAELAAAHHVSIAGASEVSA